MKYVTINNILLENVESGINYNFEYEFVGRKLKANYKENYDKLTSDYFESDEFINRNITFSFNLEKDENHCIESVKIHKYRDKSFGHGRPVVDELEITKKDRNAIRQCINNSVDLTIDDEYDRLLETVKSREELSYGFKLDKITTKGVSLFDKNNKPVLVSKEIIKKSLAISHKYLEILYDESLLEDNEEVFDKNDIKPLLAITLCCVFSEYYGLENLQKEADRRKIIKESEKGYKQLVKAIKAENDEDVNKYLKYTIVYENDFDENKNHPLILSLMKHPKYVEELLRSGSYANPQCRIEKYGEHIVSALDITFKNKDYKSMQLIADCYNPNYNEEDIKTQKDIDKYNSAIDKFSSNVSSCLCRDVDFAAAEILIPHTKGMIIDTSHFFYELDADQVEFLSSFNNINVKWERKYFEKMVLINLKTCERMVEQGCNLDSINCFIENDLYDLFEISMNKWVKQQDKFFQQDSYNKIFFRDPKWHEIIRNAVWAYKEYDNKYLSEIFITDRSLFDDTVAKYNLDISSVQAVSVFLNNLLKTKELNRFKDFVKSHNVILCSKTLCDFDKYLDNYNEKEKENILSFICENYGRINYLNNYSYEHNMDHKSNDNYVKALYKYGSNSLVDKFINSHLICSTNNISDFINHFKENYYESLRYCNEYACNQLVINVINHLKKAEKSKSLFEGAYSDKVYLMVGEVYRTLSNLWLISGYELPQNEEVNNKRIEIVRENMLWFLQNVDVSILSNKGAIYENNKNPSSVLHDIENLKIQDQRIINKVVSDYIK